jgi:hypothetical protein
VVRKKVVHARKERRLMHTKVIEVMFNLDIISFTATILSLKCWPKTRQS